MTAEPHIIFDEVNERQAMFHRRAFLMGGIGGLGVLALGGRLLQLQVLETQKYATLSTANQFNFRLRVPPRGRILDRNGIALAASRPDFRLTMRRDENKDIAGTLAQLATLIPLSPQKQAQLAREIAVAPRASPVAVADDLTWEEFSRVTVRAPELPGVVAEMGEARVYPFGGAFAHVIGYVSKVTAADLEKVDGDPPPLMLNPGFRIGKQGIEKALDEELRGEPGAQKVEVDSVGRVIRADPAGDVPSRAGAEVVLTLDADVQNRALEMFGSDSGACVAMDVRNGDVLCLLSAPAFDPNAFVPGIPGPLYHALNTYDHKPLLDKALSGTFPPGSTFKTMVALTALENGIDPKATHTCNGVFPFGNHVFKCDQHHGTLDLHEAIVTSCDVFFYQTALACGPDKIAATARKFGLGEIFDIGIPGQHRGVVPDKAWKANYFRKTPANQKWFPGETPSMGIGQGYTNVNALQQCTMVSRIANGQKAIVPRLIKSVGGKERPSGAEVETLPVDKEHIAFIRAAMAAVVTDPRGTGVKNGKLDLGPILMAGKTGTAQAHTYGAGGRGAHGAKGAWDQRDHGWFIAFAPADEPRYAIAALVEHGGFGGDAAAPKAREVMRTILLKDPDMVARMTQRPESTAHAEAPKEALSTDAAPPPPDTVAPGPPAEPLAPLPDQGVPQGAPQ